MSIQPTIQVTSQDFARIQEAMSRASSQTWDLLDQELERAKPWVVLFWGSKSAMKSTGRPLGDSVDCESKSLSINLSPPETGRCRKVKLFEERANRSLDGELSSNQLVGSSLRLNSPKVSAALTAPPC